MRHEGTWRAKGVADGAESMDELVVRLREEAEMVEAMRDAGVRLAGPVEDDYAPLATDSDEAARKYGIGQELEE